MKQELEKILYTKYPELFIQRTWDMKRTCMCWGCSHADGWFEILDQLCFSIMAYCEVNAKEIPQFSQIKEKFGTLTIYIDNADSIIQDLVDKAEKASESTCEICGSRDESVTTEGDGWISTQCGKCRSDKEERAVWPQG